MHTPDVARRCTRYDDGRFILGNDLVPLSEGNVDREREEELKRLQESMEEATEFVFQQRLEIARLHGTAYLSKAAEQLLHVHDSTGKSRSALKQLLDLEDGLCQQVNQYIRASNVTALHFLNEKQYSRALQILLGVEAIVQKGAGKGFPFFAARDCIVQGSRRGFAQSVEDPQSANEGGVQEIFVPFFTGRHEKMRQSALAVVENNIGLYHFKIAEYELAGRRISRALHLEELLDVETVGVTYFNLAQTQHQLGCMEEALSAISLAEESIEKRICDYQMQRNHLRRIVGCENGSSPTVLSGLERRRLDIYLRWREGVCLLSRVLEMHGRWLQSNGAYKAALHRYEQGDRWFSSVGPHSTEEKVWWGQLHQHIRECKRSLRHNGCVPKAPVASTLATNAAVPLEPKSTIVTTALPRKIEILVDMAPKAPLQNGRRGGKHEEEEVKEAVQWREKRRRKLRWQQLQQQQMGVGENCGQFERQRHADANGLSFGVSNRMPSENTKWPSSDSALNLYRHPGKARRPPWDCSTVIGCDDGRRSRWMSTDMTSPSNSGAQTTSSRGTSATSMTPCPARQRHQQQQRRQQQQQLRHCMIDEESEHPYGGGGSSSPPNAAWVPPGEGIGCSSSAAQKSMALNRLLTESRFNVRRAWQANSNSPVPPLSGVCVVPPVRRVYILQAFARAMVSLLETRWRAISRGMRFVVPSGFTESLFSLSNSGGRHLTSDTPQATPESCNSRGNHTMSNGGVHVSRPCGKSPLNPCNVLLAFVAAHRSCCLVREKRLDEQCAKLMASVQLCASGRDRAQTHMCTRWLNDLSTTAGSRECEHSCSSNQTSRIGEEGVNGSTSPHEIGSNGVSIPEERFQRRYNSLLRMLPQGEPGDAGCAAAKMTNSHLKCDPVLTINYVVGPGMYTALPAKARVSEGSSCTHDGAAKLCSIPSSSSSPTTAAAAAAAAAAALRQLPCRSPSSTQEPVVDSEIMPREGSHSAFQWSSHQPVVVQSLDGSDVLDRSKLYDRLCGLPPRHPVLLRKSSFSRATGSFITRATKELIRQRALREEAALIIQTVWREWRKWRQSEAVRRLIYR